jgi:hypothetical protein
MSASVEQLKKAFEEERAVYRARIAHLEAELANVHGGVTAAAIVRSTKTSPRKDTIDQYKTTVKSLTARCE